jgi:hypothetical protein
MTLACLQGEGCHDLLELSLPVPSTTSWRAEIEGWRFSGIVEIDGSFWAESNLERLKERSTCNNLARLCSITLCWDHAGLSHAKIAASFRMPSSNSVAQTIRRTKTQDAQTLKVLKQQIGNK